MLRVFKLLVQNTDEARLGLTRLKGGVGVRWGSDWVRNSQGKGTCYTVYTPRFMLAFLLA